MAEGWKEDGEIKLERKKEMERFNIIRETRGERVRRNFKNVSLTVKLEKGKNRKM